MIKTVIDTNVFISGIYWPKGRPWQILNLFEDSLISVIYSKPLYDEIENTVTRTSKKLNIMPSKHLIWLDRIINKAHFINNLPSIKICRDPKDNMVLATAVAGQAEYLITGDKDLLTLQNYQKVKIVTPQKFLTLFTK